MALQIGAVDPADEACANLVMMGYDEKYITRALAVHAKSRRGQKFDLSLLVEIIARLKAKDEAVASAPFKPHFYSPSEAQKLRVGDSVDYRFENGRYILCRVMQRDEQQNSILLHPLGEPAYVTRHNRTCHIAREYHRLAAAKSVSLRRVAASHRLSKLSVDDYLDIWSGGWRHGRIIKVDPKSSQVKVLFVNREALCNEARWFHLENDEEVAPFKTMALDEHGEDAEEKKAEELFTNTSPAQSRTASPKYSLNDSIGHGRGWPKLSLGSATSISSISTMTTTSSSISKRSALSSISVSAVTAGHSNPHVHRSQSVPPNQSQANAASLGVQQQRRSHRDSFEEMYDDENSAKTHSPQSPRGDHKLVIKHGAVAISTVVGHENEDNKEESSAHAVTPNVTPATTPVTDEPEGNEMVQQLLAFGYAHDEVRMAMRRMTDHDDINGVIEFLAEHEMHRMVKESMDSTRSHTRVDVDVDCESESSDGDTIADADCDDIDFDDAKALPESPQLADNEARIETAVFGMKPILLSSTMLPLRDYGAPIPNVLVKLREALIQQNGLGVKGIFKAAEGHEAQMAKVEQQLNNGELFTLDLASQPPLVLASLIKLFFARLPQALLGEVSAAKLRACRNMQTAGELIESELGEPNESYVKWLLDLLLEVTQHEESNCMSIKNLAKELAPALHHEAREAGSAAQSAVVKFVQLCILWRHFSK